MFADPGNTEAPSAGRRLPAARLRGRERHLAQLLPHRRGSNCAAAVQAPAHRRPAARGWPGALTIEQLFDTLAIRVDGPRAADETLVIDWNFTDAEQAGPAQLSNGALIQTAPGGEPAQLRLTLTKPAMLKLLATQRLDGRSSADGDQQALATLVGLLDSPDTQFPIVTP